MIPSQGLLPTIANPKAGHDSGGDIKSSQTLCIRPGFNRVRDRINPRSPGPERG